MKQVRSQDATRVRGTWAGGGKPCDITVRGGRVVSVERCDRRKPDIGSHTAILGPTLFDIQVNGYGGINLQGDGVRPEDFLHITERLAAWGVSHWIPTLITGAQADMEHGCRVFAQARRDRTVARAMPGLHLEGPYISPKDGPRGAHALKHVRKPNIREFDRLMDAAEGHISYTTVAPEVEGAIPYIKAVVRRGVIVSLGHHDAGAEQVARAVDAGARLCTHLGNGMSAMIPRHHNPIWPQLADDRLACSFIADLHHLPEEVLKCFVRAKGPVNTILTSDVVHITGLKPGHYDLGGVAVELKRSGHICLSGTELLAGSSLVLLQGVVNAAEHTGLTLEQAFASASTVPARLLGLRHRFDPPRAGHKANFVVFEMTGPARQHRVKMCGAFIDGRRTA